MKRDYSEITPYIEELAKISRENNKIKPEMYLEHNVFRGLRDLNGTGVVTGLTEISRIKSKEIMPGGQSKPCEGELAYRGIDIKDLTNGFLSEDRFGFEETVYLLLFSELPSKDRLDAFKEALADYRSLPPSFVRDIILKAPGKDMMNILTRCVLCLYAYDNNPDDTSVENVLRQCMQLIAVFPMLAIYAYCSHRYYHRSDSLYIHTPDKKLSTAENIFKMLREDGKFSPLEAKILDLALVLHAEHGGGNNSTFTTHVVTSSGTDTYSAIAAALGSLKGPRHGGANKKVVGMFKDMKKTINVKNKDEIADYLEKLLDKKAYDGLGLIYGMGHAVYSVSDPRADILMNCAKELAAEKGCEQDYELYETVAKLAPEIIRAKRKMYKGVSANVDFYSGLIYQMLDIPRELYTPLFAIARVVGWSAHRIEEIQNNGKIIRPSYISVKDNRPYIKLDERL